MTAVDSPDPIHVLHDLEDRHATLLAGLAELEERVEQVLRQWGASRGGAEKARDLIADRAGPTG